MPGDMLARLLYDYKFISEQVYGTMDGVVHSKGTCNFPETEEDPILTPEEIVRAEEKERAARKRELARQKALEKKQREIDERLRRQKECQLELRRVPHELQKQELSDIADGIIDLCRRYNVKSVSIHMKGKIAHDFTGKSTGSFGGGIVYNVIQNSKTLYLTIYPEDYMSKLTLPQNSDFLFQNSMGMKFIRDKICVEQFILDAIYWDDVVQAEGMFAQFPAFSIRILNQNAYKLENLSRCFSRQRIRAIEFKAFKTSNIKSTYRMFYGCKNLRLGDVKLRWLNLEKTDKICEMFGNCTFNPYDLVQELTIKKLEDTYGYDFTTTWVPHNRLDNLGCLQVILSKCHWKGYNKQKGEKLDNRDFDIFSAGQQTSLNAVKKIG